MRALAVQAGTMRLHQESYSLHPQYHTPKDEPESIDYPKLTRMTQWLYLTGWYIAQADQRPTVIPGFRLER